MNALREDWACISMSCFLLATVYVMYYVKVPVDGAATNLEKFPV